METLAIQNISSQQQKDIEATVKRERPRLFSFIRQRVKNDVEAEDIVQDVFYQLVAGYQSLRNLERVTSWLFTVARNKITDRYRKHEAIPMSEHQLVRDDEEEAPGLESILPDMDNGPEQLLDREAIWSAVESGLDEMPSEQKEVFVMHEFEDLSFKEIANITGESVNTLLSRKRYAVLFLRKWLKDLYEDIITK